MALDQYADYVAAGLSIVSGEIKAGYKVLIKDQFLSQRDAPEPMLRSEGLAITSDLTFRPMVELLEQGDAVCRSKIHSAKTAPE